MRYMPKLTFMIGVISMLSFSGCSDTLKYEKYSSKDPEINITMDYISGWLYRETRGAKGSYAQVIFLEPQRQGKDFKAAIAVIAESSPKVDKSGLSSFVDNLLLKRSKLKDMKLLSKDNSLLCAAEAISVELSYQTLDKLYSVDAKLIPVKEKIIILGKDGKFYTLRYINTDVEYAKFNKAFGHVVKTIQFKK
jgi:hypothetical protein